jgi:formylglycine-generating enzyme required for sulfatase activity
MKNVLLIFSLAIVSLTIYSFAAKDRTKPFPYLGQTLPPDMEFIPGNGTIPSFYISKSEETNLAYATYMDWLGRVYVDYPEVVFNATPRNVAQGELAKFNDPILRGQLRNPAFAYYPVTGLDWKQIQEYLCWKTDRLNESIMIRLKYLKYNPYQVNEDNFGFEAYMAGQYEGAVVKEVPGKGSYYNNSGEIDQTLGKFYPFLFPGYRLPTEEEWEYAAKDEFRNTRLSDGGAYPYGKEYFILDYLFKDPYGRENVIKKAAANAGTYEPADLKRIKGGTTYDNSYYGVYNMGDNVKEWLMDVYTPEVKHYQTAESVYASNGFVIAADSMYRNEDGYIMEKDSLGRMYYRTMGISNNGNDFRVMQYRYKIVRTYFTKALNPDSVKTRLAQKQLIRDLGYTYAQYKGYRYYAPYDVTFQIRKIGDKWINLEYYNIVKKSDAFGKEEEWMVLDTNRLLNSPKYVEERKYIVTRHWEYLDGHVPTVQDRVVKSGTWKNPSVTARESMKETDASADVGFRTVIPYLGMLIDKRNTVKWR